MNRSQTLIFAIAIPLLAICYLAYTIKASNDDITKQLERIETKQDYTVANMENIASQLDIDLIEVQYID